MKNASHYADRLSKLLRRLRKQVSVPEAPQRDPLQQLIWAFLAWESSRNKADQLMPRLMNEVVDPNDLRVTDPRQVAGMIGDGVGDPDERARRLHRVLQSIYVKQHGLDLSGLTQTPKREARQYLENLDGMVPFVAACVCLLNLDAHAIPVDEQLRKRLAADGVVDGEATLEQVQSFLEKNIRADDALEAFFLLRAYVERPIKVQLDGAKRSGGSRSGKAGGSSSKSARSATGRKKTRSKTSSQRQSASSRSRKKSSSKR